MPTTRTDTHNHGRTVTTKTITLADLRKRFAIPDDADFEIRFTTDESFSEGKRNIAFLSRLPENAEIIVKWERI